jgi:hypothetical protein
MLTFYSTLKSEGYAKIKRRDNVSLFAILLIKGMLTLRLAVRRRDEEFITLFLLDFLGFGRTAEHGLSGAAGGQKAIGGGFKAGARVGLGSIGHDDFS